MVGTLVATLASGAVWAGVAAVGAGRLDAYPATMTAWRGAGGVDVLEPWVRTVRLAVETGDRAFVVPAAAMVLALLLSLALLVPRVAPGIDLRLRVWAAAYAVYLLAVVDGHTSVVRYLVPLFPLAVVLVGAHRARRRRQEASGPEDDAAWVSRWWPVRTAFWVAVGVVGQVGWIWWLVLFEPPADLPP